MTYGIGLYLLTCFLSYSLWLGYWTQRYPYQKHFDAFWWMLFGPLSLWLIIAESREKAGRCYFRLRPLTVVERYIAFCDKFGYDYMDFDTFRLKYR